MRSLVPRIRLAIARRRATKASHPNDVERLCEILEASGLSSFAENLKAADAAVQATSKRTWTDVTEHCKPPREDKP